MHKILFLLIILSFSQTSKAQQLEWAKQAHNNTDIASDRFGNVYIMGVVYHFEGTVDVNPGPGTYNVTGTWLDPNPTMYIAKFDSNGIFVWARTLNTYSGSGRMAVSDSGDVYIAGTCKDGGHFWGDPGNSGNQVGIQGDNISTTAYIVKLKSDGMWHWARSFDNYMETDMGLNATTDANNNVYFTGYISYNADLDPGAGTFLNTGSGYVIVKLDSDGDFLWASTEGGGYHISRDDHGNLYTAGFTGTTNYGMFVLAKYNPLGAQIWSHSIYANLQEMQADRNGCIYVTGYFQDSADFDPGTGTHTLYSTGAEDQYLLKLDSAAQFLWVKQIGGNGNDRGSALALTGDSSIYITGSFTDTVDMDPNSAVYNLTSRLPGLTDIFVEKLDTAGNFIWAHAIGDTASDNSWGIAADTSGNIFLIATAKTADLDPGNAVFVIPSTDPSFVLKWHGANTNTTGLVSQNSSTPSITVYPNPSTGTFTVTASYKIDQLRIVDALGRKVYIAEPNMEKTVIDKLPAGIYFLSIYSKGQLSTATIVAE